MTTTAPSTGAGTEGGGATPHPLRHVRFAVVSVALLMAAIDQTSVATALDRIGEGLGSSVNWVAWTITAYQLGQVIAMPVAGRLSDSWGRRRTFLVCLTLFGVSSLACSIAPNIWCLIAFRFTQALGGGGFLPAATGLVADDYAGNRDRAIGFFTSIFPLGALVGPIVGGLIVTHFGWRQIFLVNVPVALTAGVIALFLLPRGEERRPLRIDLPGIALFAVALACGMAGISQLGDGKTTSGLPLLAAGGLLVALVVRRQGRVAAPFLPVVLLRDRRFALINGINLLYGAGAVGMGSLVPYFAATRYGIDPLRTGTLLTARALGMATMSAIAAVILARTGYRRPMVIGFLVMGGSLFALAADPPIDSPLLWLAITAGISGIGIGLNGPAANNAALDLFPGDVGSAAGMRSMFRQLGAISSVSLTTAIAAGSSMGEGRALQVAYMVCGAILVAVVPLIRFVPERRR